MSEATKELIWMNQREEPEVSRDWARTDLDLVDLKLYGEVGQPNSSIHLSLICQHHCIL